MNSISVRSGRLSSLILSLAVIALAAGPAQAQPHRATRLGNPATRFSDPLRTPEDLRALFRNEGLRPDVESILRQWGWRGNVEDLRRAALTSEIVAVRLPVGTRMPFMSSRKNGRPVTLRDVIWAGREPVDAYAFTFASNGRRYRCVTPKPCANFYVEDLGPDFPRLELVKTAPTEASRCEPIPMEIVVRNTGTRTLTEVRITDPLPSGMWSEGEQTVLNMEAGTLQPGEGLRYRFYVAARAEGTYVNTARASSAEGARAQASATTVVLAPALALECDAPAEVRMGRPADVCLEIRNVGDSTEPTATLTLPIPAGAALDGATEGAVVSGDRLTWEIHGLAPNASRQLCASFMMGAPGSMRFTPTVAGVCAPPATTQCATRVTGIPAVLLEVADLEDPMEIGGVETYIIKVTNQGSAPDTNISITSRLEESQEFVSASGPTDWTHEDGVIRFGPLPYLAPSAAATWEVKVRAAKAGDVRFATELTSDQLTRAVRETESTNQY